MAVNRWFLAAALLLCGTTVAEAQKFTDVAQQLDAADQMLRPPLKPVATRVQVNYQFLVPGGRADTIEEQKASITSSHAALYQMAAHECEQLQIVMAGDCRLVSMTINNSSQGYNQANLSLQVSGSAMFDLTSRLPAAIPETKP